MLLLVVRFFVRSIGIVAVEVFGVVKALMRSCGLEIVRSFSRSFGVVKAETMARGNDGAR